MVKKSLMLLIYIYKKFVSPALPRACRFYPSCSEYAYSAIGEYGAPRGVLLAIKRILRCHPFNPGGYDPIPIQKNTEREAPVARVAPVAKVL
jgi:hypothetical protein